MRQRSLLALLLLHRNEILSVEQISRALCREDDELAMLRELVGAETLVSRPWGHGLRALFGSVDADEFELLVERAQNEEPEVAVATLREALTLWRGPAFADVAAEPFA